MSEPEKRLRAVLSKRCEQGAYTTGTIQHDALDALLAEHRAEVSAAREEVDAEWRVAISKALGLPGMDRATCLPLQALAAKVSAARDAALEEAGQALGGIKGNIGGRNAANVILSLRSAPAQVVPVAKVRDVLCAYRNADDPGAVRVCSVIEEIARDLRVALDATGGEVPRFGLLCDCNGVPHRYAPGCPDTAPRETASEENGLLPKARLCEHCGHVAHAKKCAERLHGTSSGAVRICKCKRGVGRDVSDASGSVKP